MHGLDLVLRIDVRVDETDGDRLDLLLDQPLGKPIEGLEVDRHQDLSPGTRALIDLETQAPLDQWLRLAEAQVVESRRTEPTELENVAESPGGEQRDPAPLALDHGVGGHRRAVSKFAEVGGGDRAFAQQLEDAALDREAVVIRGRRYLLAVDGAVRGKDDDVSEGAADVYTDAIFGF